MYLCLFWFQTLFLSLPLKESPFFPDILIPTLTLTQQVKSCVQFFQISVFKSPWHVDKCVYIYRLHLPFSAISHLFFLASSNLPVKNPMFYHFVITFLNYNSFLAWWIGGVDSRPHGKLLSMHFRKAEVDQHSRSYFFFFPFGVGIFGAENPLFLEPTLFKYVWFICFFSWEVQSIPFKF